ncbi:MAG: hypothetical protein MUO54_09665 [Anaerolineales bacterium]|nr:hypothetical protein [Anaerolineales bacterium]
MPAEKADLEDLLLDISTFIGRIHRTYPVRLLSLHEMIREKDKIDERIGNKSQ